MQGLLCGQIEVIGVIELLRVPVTGKKSGELVLANQEYDARCYFQNGELVQTITKELIGSEALDDILTWKNGEFEFRESLLPQSLKIDKALHAYLVAILKHWYASRVRVEKNTTKQMSDSILAVEEYEKLKNKQQTAVIDSHGKILSQQTSFEPNDAALCAITYQLAAACAKLFKWGSPSCADLTDFSGKTLKMIFREDKIFAEVLD